MYCITGLVHSCEAAQLFLLLILTVQQVFDEGTDEEEDDYDMYHEIRKLAFIMYLMGLDVIYTDFVSSYCFTWVSNLFERPISTLYSIRIFPTSTKSTQRKYLRDSAETAN